MRSVHTTPLAAAGLLAAVTVISGCSTGNSLGPGGNTTSQVRSINALQGCATNVDIEQLNVSPVPFGNLTSGAAPAPYILLRSGLGLHYAVFPTGTTTGALTQSDVDFTPHDPNGNLNTGTYTLVATGICNGGSGFTTPHLVRLIDAFPSAFIGVNAGSVAIRVINLVPDLSGGISLASNGAAIHGSDDAGTNNVQYAANSGADNSHYNGGISLTGGPTLTIRTNANAVLATVPTGSLQPNHAYTLFVVGEATPTAGGSAITVVPVQDF